MNIDRIVFLFAGILIMLSVTLSYFHHFLWIGGAALVGFMLFQSALTGWCPLVMVLKKLGFKSGNAF